MIMKGERREENWGERERKQESGCEAECEGLRDNGREEEEDK